MKIDTRDYNEVHLGTDFHWHHDRTFIWGQRKFNNVREQTKSTKEALKVLGPKDLLVYQGDWALNCEQKVAEALMDEIPCDIIYVMGNHDQRILRMINDRARRMTKPDGLFGCSIISGNKIVRFRTGILEIQWIKKDGSKQSASHSHYPLEEWNHMNHGAWNLSGHCHGNGEAYRQPYDLSRKALDMSYDVNGKWLLTFEEVCGIMDAKKVTKFHHGKP